MNLIYVFLAIWKIVLSETIGVAEVEELRDPVSKKKFLIYFEQGDDAVVMFSLFKLPDSYSVTWQIHELPVKMGSQSCSNLLLGGCFECSQSLTDGGNTPVFDEKLCIKGDTLSISRTRLSDCAKLRGKDGLIGRSVVLRVQTNSNSLPSHQTYCATIFEQNSTHPDFTSTIAWFSEPYAGYVAFRKESRTTSYIIVNLTRTVDMTDSGQEALKWEIRKNSIDREEVYDPGNKRLNTSSDYNSRCSIHKSHENCAEGDLWRKHGRIVLENNLEVNPRMFIDNNLDLNFDTSGLLLVLSNTSKDNVEHVVVSSRIAPIQPLSIEVPFQGGDKLIMTQRDDWSAIKHWFEPSAQNFHGTWEVTIYSVPTIQIFGGDDWECKERWSEEKFLEGFKTYKTENYLSANYTLYGQNSIMYRGVHIKREGSTTDFCSSITYPKDQERIAFSKLESVNQAGDHKVVVVLIEHTILRQTTLLVATQCRSISFFLELTEATDCQNELYNPFSVCPAVCESRYDARCGAKCSDECCSMCVYNSSFLCPLGDLRRRLGIFGKTSRHQTTNTEKIFNVKNAVALPMDKMLHKYIGQKLYDEINFPELIRCGQIVELGETVVVVDNIIGGNITLTQKAAWQSITVNWEGIKLNSIKFRNYPKPITPQVCSTPEDDSIGSYEYSDFPTAYEIGSLIQHTLPKEDNSPTFFGPKSVLGKSVTIVYTTRSNEQREVTLNIKPFNTPSDTLQAIFDMNNTNMLRFDFEQRIDHLTEDTFIKVQVLSKKFCLDQTIKWYIINKESAESFVIGGSFYPQDYDDKAIWNLNDNEKSSCVTRKASHKLLFGDLSGRLGDIELKRLDKIFVHEALPLSKGEPTKYQSTRVTKLAQVKGHFLVLTDRNDTILGKMELKEAERNNEPTPGQATSSGSKGVRIIVSVLAGVVVILIGSFVVMKICIQPARNNNSTTYQTIAPDNSSGRPAEKKLCVEKRTGKQLYIIPHKLRMFEVLTEDEHGHQSWRHTEDLKLNHGQDSDPSTNGSSLKSQRTVTEGNFYMVSPAVGLPHTAVISQVDSSSSSSSSSSSPGLKHSPSMTSL